MKESNKVIAWRIATAATLFVAACTENVSPTQTVEESGDSSRSTETTDNDIQPKTEIPQFEPTITKTVPEQIVEETPDATSTPEEIEPTNTPLPTSTWTEFGGEYSSGQIEIINGGALSQHAEKMSDWEKWWGTADNRPFHPETTLLKRVPFFPKDDPENANKTIVVWQALGENYQGKLFYYPIDREGEKFLSSPPETAVDTIPEGFGPLEISSGDEGLELANINGELVRIDPRTEKVVEKINFQTAQWEDIIMENWESGLVDGSALIPTQRVRLSLENSPWEGGEVTLFYLRAAYAHKVIRIKEVSPDIDEITWGFNLKGNHYTYKTLYTRSDMVRPNRTIAHFGADEILLGDLAGPQVAGLESVMEGKPGWIDTVFTEPEEEAAREVWGQLRSDSEIKSQIIDFWSEGDIAQDWEIDQDGVVDLTKIIALTWGE